VDASVVAKWYIAEEDSDRALQIRDLHSDGKLVLSSPVLIIYEVGNALTRHPRFTNEDSAKAFQSLMDLGLGLRSLAEPTLLEKTFEISRQLRITFYDAAYVALARDYDTMLITADKALHRNIKRHCRTRILGETKPEELTV
jgi:predicted nucleic acid-binding protein